MAHDGRQEAPAYNGAIWIDKESHHVLRIEMRAVGLAAGFPIDSEFRGLSPFGAESTVVYGKFRAINY